MLENAWIIPALMALSFLLILGFGKRLPKGGSEIGIAAVAICFVLACATGYGWIQRVNHPPEAAHGEEAAAGHGEEAEGGAAADDEQAEDEAGPTVLDEGATADDLSAESAELADDTEAGAVADEEDHGAGAGGAAAEDEHAEAAEEEHHVTPPVVREAVWFQNGGQKFTVGTMVDGLAAMMLFVVTAISLLVHIFSTDYVGGDRRYTHYFAFLSLFTSSMLFLVLAESTLQLLVAWELVGLCSFALIGHWWEEKPNSDAALKAFLTNRVGDVGLICGVIILFWAADGSFDIIRINELANSGAIGHTVLLVASLSLMAAVMSKSGQFILHTWLPDAMAGPTPVSALIHAATMVVAGVFMIARLYGVFWHGLSIGSANINAMAMIGAITLLFGALLAFVQNDIKKVLAYSTVSQLGYMVMALGVGAWTAGVFHLFTHAFFKACLFLGSGSLAHHIHSFDMKKDMGGMRKVMPRTYATFLVGTAALMGVPLVTAGFWSKDEILAGANGLGGEGGYKLMLVMGLLGAVCTCAYMTRAIWYVFFGEARGKSAEHELHENGPRIVVPLIILAFMAVVAGWTNIPDSGIFSFMPEGWALRFEHYVEPTAGYFPAELDPTFRHPEFTLWIAVLSSVAIAIGAGGAYAWFWKGLGPHGITAKNKVARAGYRLLENKYYLDHLYTGIIAGGVKGPIARAANWFNQHILDGIVNGVGKGAQVGGRFVYEKIDQGVIDTLVDETGHGAEGSGGFLRRQQTGKVQAYGAYLFAGAALLAAIFVIAST
jgi:NADH-quinone oxidoreductase subunit L